MVIAAMPPPPLQVEAYTKQSTQKLQIMGYYQCNETLGDVDMSGIARRAADRIQSLYPSAVAVVVRFFI